MEYEFHEAANEFPLLDDKRLNELAEDIEQNGLREPIYLFDNKILDGRNRYKACQKKNITPKYETLPGDIDPFTYVWSLNGERRDLAAAQRYGIWKNCMEKSAAWQSEQKRIQEEANRARAEAAKERERTETGTFQGKIAAERYSEWAEGKDPVTPQPVCSLAKQQETRGNRYVAPKKEKDPVTAQPVRSPASKPSTNAGSQAKATASKTNRGTVERMDRLYRKRKDLYDKVVAGQITETEALRRMKKDSVKERTQELPKNKYRVIYADPPWSYNDKQGGEISAKYGAAEKHYPSMNLSELKAMAVPAADDAVLFLWVTSPLLPDGIDLCRAWGFKYKASFVWDKIKHNMGHYNSVRHEFLLIATKGSCTPDNMKLFDSVQSIERSGKHSEKPDEFRQIINTLYPHGKKIELFARKKSEGWDVWGNEL